MRAVPLRVTRNLATLLFASMLWSQPTTPARIVEMSLNSDGKWMAYLLDVEKVAKCLPGAQLTQIVDDKTFKGKMKVKMGAMDLTFSGTVTITELDNQTGRVVMKATGREEKGKGQADANVVAQITDQGGSITKAETLGRRQLAYEILHKREGTFVDLELEGSGREIAELERRMRVNDRILRYLTVRMDEHRRRADKLRDRRARKAAKRPFAAMPSGRRETPAFHSDEGYER